MKTNFTRTQAGLRSSARISHFQTLLRPRGWLRVAPLLLLAVLPSAYAGQGAANYLDFDDVNPGFGTATDTSETALNWSTSSAGTATATARPSGTQLTIGTAATDFAGSPPFIINLNGGGNLQGVAINSTNVNVTFTGTANTHNNSGPNRWSITNFAILNVNDTRQTFADTVKGVNWNNVNVIFQGGGTINFLTPLGANSTASNNMNMPGGVINLQMSPVTSVSTYSGGFTLTDGTLNFASSGSSNQFNGFVAGKNFYFNGGTIDNTSGSPMTVSVGAGGYSIGGNINFRGSSSLTLGPSTAPVTLNALSLVTVGANSLSILGPISGSGGIIKAGAGSLVLSGANSYTGSTIVTNGSSLILVGSATFPDSPLVVSDSPMDLSGLTTGALTTPSFSVTNSTLIMAIVSSSGTNIAAGTLNVGGAATINIASLPLLAGYPTTLHLISGATVNGTLNFNLGTLPPSTPPFVASIVNRPASGLVDLVVTGGPIPVRALNWSGLNNGTSDGTWDVANTPTWLDSSQSPTTFNQSDFVTLNDKATGQTSINMTTTVVPGSLAVSNNNLLYTLGGSGKISGNVALVKQGTGTLILDETGGNDFSNGVLIASGVLQVGNNDGAGSLPPTGNIVNNSSLVFTRNDGSTVNNVISGTGSITQNGTGFLMLNGANTFTGAVSVAEGTLQIGNGSALGTTNGITTVASGATLDFAANANNIGQEQVVVSGAGVGGQGALYNSSGSATFVGPNVARVTLVGDTTFGGSGRWDLRSSSTADPTLASLSTAGAVRKITKIGGNQVGLVGITVDPALGDIEVQSGIFSMEAATTSLGNPAANFIVWPGATFQLFAVTNFVDKVFTLGSDGLANSLSATSGSNNVVGPMTLTNDCLFNVNNAAVSLTLNNVLNGPGRITKVGAGLLNLAGNNPGYTGGLQLNAGTLEVSGALSNALGVTISGGKFVLNGSLLGPAGLTNNFSVAIVSGSGSNAGPADISGVLNPGDTNAFGTLTFGGLVLEAGATVNFDFGIVNTPGAGTNDLIVVNGDLVVNGNTININSLGLLKIGVPYTLFNYTGNLIWNSDLVVQNQGSATYSFALDTNTPGQVNVVFSGGPPVWNGGSTTDSNWSDANNWHGVPIALGPLGFGGTTRTDNINDTFTDSSYGPITFSPDAGAFVLNGNPIQPAGNIVNYSGNAQTIDLGLDFSASFTLDGGVGGLIVGGGLTNNASAFTTVSLAGNGLLTNLLASTQVTGTNVLSTTSANANWTLLDNSSSAPITVPWALDIHNGNFSFGAAGSAPNLTTTTVNGVPQDNQVGITSGGIGTLNISNGTFTTFARLNTATVANSIGVVNVVGGTFNCGGQFQGANGSNPGEQSIWNMIGGTVNIGADTNSTAQFYVASRGTGTLNMLGGTLNCGNLDISRNAAGNTIGSVGVVNLNGGVLACQRVGSATANSQAGQNGVAATFNFNGGILRARASSASFFQGNVSAPAIPITTIVKTNGAIIDTDTNAISILEPLQHDSILGSSADGGITKLGPGTLTLTAVSTYTGPTLVSNGTLVVNGSVTVSAVTVATNATLAGTGICGNDVTSQDGGAIAPANVGVIGTLTVSGIANLNGIAAMDINATTATNDVLKAGSINYGGTLAVTNLGASLHSGASFTLFNATNYGGAFTLLQLPPLWPGLSWVTSTLGNSGTISVIGTIIPPQIGTVLLSGNSVTLNGSGGLKKGTYYVLEATNITQALSTWTRIATNTFDASGNFNWTGTPNIPLLPAAFFRIQGQ